MANRDNNIILIGMPASGKSTIGIVLAKALRYSFIDGDILIQNRTGMTLCDYMEKYGNESFLKLENEGNAGISCERTVIAPGGSICYATDALKHFKQIGTIIYLSIDYDMLEDRLHDARERGVVLEEGKSLLDLYNERVPLYEKYADITIAEGGSTLENLVVKIVSELTRRKLI